MVAPSKAPVDANLVDCRRSLEEVGLGVDDVVQSFSVQYANMALLDFYHAIVNKFRECAADSLQF